MKNLTVFRKILFLSFFAFISATVLADNEKPFLSERLQKQLQTNSAKDLNRLNTLIECIDTIIQGEKGFDVAYPYIQEVGELAKYLDDDYGKAIGFYFMGRYYYEQMGDQSKLSECIFQENKAQQIAETLPQNEKNQILGIRICMALSACYGDCSMFPEKLLQIQKGLKINNALPHKQYESTLNGHLAGLKAMMEEYEDAIIIHEQLLQDSTLPPRVRYIYNFNIARCFFLMNQYDSALFYYAKADENRSTLQEMALIDYSIGNVYYESKDLDTAEKFYLKALPLIPKMTYSMNLNSLAQLYLDKKQYHQALDYVNQSIQFEKDTILMDSYVQALYIKVMILKEMKQYEEALSVLLDYVVLSDSIHEKQNYDKVNEMITQQKVKRAEEQMQLQNDAEKAKQQYVFATIVSILVFVIIIVLLLLNRKRILLRNKNIALRAEKVEKNFKLKELQTAILSQKQKVEILNKVIDHLLVFHKSTPDASDKINSFIIDLKKSFKDDALHEFAYYFEQIYPDFIKKLQAEFPEITPYELYLCEAYKLNMTMSEVATVNNISEESVKTLHGKLKATLHLTDSEISVTDWLQKY